MAELDILLLPFFDEMFLKLDPVEQRTYIDLLKKEDPELWRWFSRKGKPEDPNLAALVEKILDRVQH